MCMDVKAVVSVLRVRGCCVRRPIATVCTFVSVTLTLISLSDIEVMASDSKQVFRLHRAVLWARSEWFRALIDRWSHAPRNNATTAAPMELSVMSGDVLACVVEYLYTGCGAH